MKRMNNRGFAISSLLYGLLLVAFLVVAVLMSVMAANRKNTSTLINKIEEDLNRHSVTVTEFEYTGDVQEFVVPHGKQGWYKIELWGAAGAGEIGDTTQNRGSYTSGIVYLEANTHLYIYVGGTGVSGSRAYNQIYSTVNGGGGATDVRTVSGGANAEDVTSMETIIMLAGGGAKGGNYRDSAYNGGTNAGDSFISGYGGQRIEQMRPVINGVMMHAVNGGSGKAMIELVSQNPPTVYPTKKVTTLNNISRIRDCIKVANLGSPQNGGKELWSEVQAISEVNYNTHLNNVARKAFGGVTTLGDSSNEIIDAATGENPLTNTSMGAIDYTTTLGGTTVLYSGGYCITSKFTQAQNVEEISFFHKLVGGTSITEEEISVYRNGSWQVIRRYGNGTIVPETYEGVRISSRQIGSGAVPDGTGNYYLESANGPGRLATATTSNDNRNITQLLFNEGSKKRKWTISKLGDGTYKIIEAEDFFSLQPSQTDSTGLAESGITVSTISPYTDEVWQKWNIVTDMSGYYQIQYTIPNDQGQHLCLTAEYLTQNLPLKLQPCNKTDVKQWWKLLTAEY